MIWQFEEAHVTRQYMPKEAHVTRQYMPKEAQDFMRSSNNICLM